MASVGDITRVTAKLEDCAVAVHAEASTDDPDFASLTRLSDEVGELADRLAAGFDAMNRALELSHASRARPGKPATTKQVARPVTGGASAPARRKDSGAQGHVASDARSRRARLVSAIDAMARLSPRAFAGGGRRPAVSAAGRLATFPSLGMRRARHRAAKPTARLDPGGTSAPARTPLASPNDAASAAA